MTDTSDHFQDEQYMHVADTIHQLSNERKWHDTMPLFAPDALYGELNALLPFHGVNLTSQDDSANKNVQSYLEHTSRYPLTTWASIVNLLENGPFYTCFPDFSVSKVGLPSIQKIGKHVIVQQVWLASATHLNLPYHDIAPSGRRVFFNGIDNFIFQPGTLQIGIYQSYSSIYLQLMAQNKLA